MKSVRKKYNMNIVLLNSELNAREQTNPKETGCSRVKK